MSTASNSVLSELIDERAWADVVSRLETHPHEAAGMIARGYGESLPLHEACKLQPPANVVLSLIRAYEPAVSMKGQWSFLPLHFAVRSNSIHAVVPLLEAYPRAARLKEDGGKLPLHLGCQWGSSPDVIERLLTLYPEGIYVRDDDGKSPTDYAEALKAHSKDDYDKVLAAMERGLVYCAVSKAAFFRVKEEFDELMRGTVEAHNTHVTKLERAHAEEIEVHRQLEQGLRSNLKHMGEKLGNLRKENDELTNDRNDMKLQLNILENAESVLRSQTDCLETKLEEKSKEFEEKEAALVVAQGQMEGLLRNMNAITERNAKNEEEIEALSKLVLSLSASIDALTISQQFAERAMAHQDGALRMVLGDKDALVEQTLHQKEHILNETVALEEIIVSAETTHTERVVCEPVSLHDFEDVLTDKYEQKDLKSGDKEDEKSKSTCLTSAASFSSLESMGHNNNAAKEKEGAEGAKVTEESKEEEESENEAKEAVEVAVDLQVDTPNEHAEKNQEELKGKEAAGRE